MGGGCIRRLLPHLKEGGTWELMRSEDIKIACETDFVWIDSERSLCMVIWVRLHGRQFVDINVALEQCCGLPSRSVRLRTTTSKMIPNLVPRVFHLTALLSERGKTLAHAGHVSPKILEMTIK